MTKASVDCCICLEKSVSQHSSTSSKWPTEIDKEAEITCGKDLT